MSAKKTRADTPADNSEYVYDASDIDAVTDGHVNSPVLRAWIKQGRLRSKLLPESSQGKRSLYSKQTVFEVALISAFSRTGVPLDVATQWTLDVLQTVNKQGKFIPFFAWSSPGTGLVPLIGDELDLMTAGAKLGTRFSVINVFQLMTDIETALARRTGKPVQETKKK